MRVYRYDPQSSPPPQSRAVISPACRQCGVDLGFCVRRNRKFCPSCNNKRAAARRQIWRTTNPDKARAAREREARRRRANGIRPIADVKVEARKKMLAVVAQIEPLIARRMTYAEIGKRLGMSRSAIGGYVHRARNMTDTHSQLRGETA